MSTELIAISIDALADSGGVIMIQDSPVGGSRPETFAWPDFPPTVTGMLERWFAASDEVPPKEVGNALFQHLFPMASRAALKSAFSQARAADRALVAISSSSSTLHGLPFEIAHDGEEYLVSANRVVFRHINDGAKIEPTYSEPRRFLVVLAEPSSKGDYPAWGHDQFADQIRGLLNQRDGDIDLLCHATPVQVQDALASERSVRGRYDVVLVVAHGEPPTGSGDGSLVLEGPGRTPEHLLASAFAAALTGHQGCLVLLFSCNTASVNPQNPVAGVAHRAIRAGQAGAVVAMQRPITVDAGLAICDGLISSLQRGDDIFTAFRDGITVPTLAGWEHGVPCLYTRLPKGTFVEHGREREDRLRLTSFFTSSSGSRYAISLPTFRMGVSTSDFEAGTRAEWFRLPDDVFRYVGPTVSMYDIRAVQELIFLLTTLLRSKERSDSVAIISDAELLDAMTRSHYTHYFIIGSRSHKLSMALLGQYSEDFKFHYDNKNWHIEDTREGKNYSALDPQQSGGVRDGDDYAVIEKVIDKIHGTVLFFIAGIWDSSTLAAAQYLWKERDRLARDYGSGGFQCLLKTVAGYPRIKAKILERRPQLISG